MLAIAFGRWSDVVGIGLSIVVLTALVLFDLRREAGRRVHPVAGTVVGTLGLALVVLIVIRFVRRAG